MTKQGYADFGSIIGRMMRNTIEGRETLDGLVTSEDGILNVNGHKRVLLDDIAVVGTRVVATTHTGTRYTIETLADEPVSSVRLADITFDATYQLRRANVIIEVAGEETETYEDGLFGYDVGSGTIVVFDERGDYVRRSSTVRSFEVIS